MSKPWTSPSLLMQVEVPLFFSPLLQAGGVRRPAGEALQKAAFGWVTIDVWGVQATSELSGLPCLEDSRFMVGNEDIEAILPSSIIDAITSYVLDKDH